MSRATESLLRHYVGTAANKVGQPVHIGRLFDLAPIEEIGEGMLARIEKLTDERDQALIRAEAAEAELEAYRRTERKVS